MLLTWLYVPGDRPDRFAKAVASGADAVILDLEDGVALARKDYARSAVREFVAEPHSVPVSVRLSGLDDIFSAPGLAGFRLPKVESAFLAASAVAMADVPVHCLVESALGVEKAFTIASVPGVGGISLGEEDLRSSLGVSGESGLLYARSRIVVAASAAALPPPPMSVFTDLSDFSGLVDSCDEGRRMGFLGRAALHPKQLPAIVAGFRPAPAEVDRAQALLAAVTPASGALVLPDGRFADRALVASAQRIVDLAARCS